jgi:hypothetical protein
MSQAATWRLTWGRQGWRVIRSEPASIRAGHHAPVGVVIRYKLQRTLDARHPPTTPR